MSKKSKKGLMQQLFPAEGETVPKLRFPEFRDAREWDVKPFGDGFKRLTTKNSENNQNPLTISAQLGLVNQLEYFNKRIAANNLSGYYLLHKGDFAYNKSYSQGYPMGAIKPLKLYDKGVVSTLYICFRTKKGYNECFYEHYFESGLLDPEIGKIAQEGGRAHGLLNVSVKEFFKDVNIYVPWPNEQQKIADCLSSIDDLITAQAQKIESLKDHKKGLMQQLFPAEGETVPKLRFPEFLGMGKWEENILGCVSDVRDGTHDSPKFYRTGRLLITSKNLLPNGELDLVNANLISEQDYKQINKRSKVDIGDIIFGMIGTIGNPVRVRTEGYAIKNVALIKQKKELLNSYLVQFLNSEYIAREFSILNSGNSQKFISLGKIRSLSFPTPPITEQQKIADCLSSIDDLITAQAKKLELLNDHKKGLMQQLFPTSAEVEQ